jgi:hypothetical protein
VVKEIEQEKQGEVDDLGCDAIFSESPFFCFVKNAFWSSRYIANVPPSHAKSIQKRIKHNSCHEGHCQAYRPVNCYPEIDTGGKMNKAIESVIDSLIRENNSLVVGKSPESTKSQVYYLRDGGLH